MCPHVLHTCPNFTFPAAGFKFTTQTIVTQDGHIFPVLPVVELLSAEGDLKDDDECSISDASIISWITASGSNSRGEILIGKLLYYQLFDIMDNSPTVMSHLDLKVVVYFLT